MKKWNLVSPKFIIVAVIALILLGFTLLWGHSGRTDSRGGHHNRKTGGYHYHNVGTVHDANNPYQDHTRCGICSAPKRHAATGNKMIEINTRGITLALQAGLKCMGYNITQIDGVSGPETQNALMEFLTDFKNENSEATIYITKTGSKYHRSGCRYLSKSMIPIDKKKAKERRYSPCKVCKP